VNLALFDFDGTITTRDSLPDFIRYAVGRPAYYAGLAALSPVLLAYLAGLVPNHAAKQKLLSWFFRDWPAERFHSLAARYSSQRIDGMLRAEAIGKIDWHRQRGDRVVVVSASVQDWVQPWCENRGLELVATRLAVENGRLNGRFSTPNCHGEEKVRRIREYLDLDAYGRVYAYGDSHGDEAMLAIADEAFYRRF